jgi:hypothetical protein
MFKRFFALLLMSFSCVFLGSNSVFGQGSVTNSTNNSNPFNASKQSNSDDKKQRVEVGVQFTSLSKKGDGDRNGFGGRFGYDFATFGSGKYVATAEAEINFLPGNRFVGFSSVALGSRRNGRVLQGFFGAKVGRKFDKFGVFAKVRPGFVQYSKGKQNITGTTSNPGLTTDSETNAALDVGGVLEFYPTKRITTRFDVGDTIVRFGQRNATGFDFFNQRFIPIVLGSETKHNFQFSAGIGFRF